MDFKTKAHEPQIYPVGIGDVTTLGGIPCRVKFCNYAKNTATIEFPPWITIHDYQEKDLTIKKFGAIVNRRDNRAHRAKKPRAERMAARKLKAKARKAKKNG